MHDEFLRLVARAYVKNEAEIENHGMPFGKTLFVFPNRRSMKFFQKYLGEEFGKIYSMPLFTPDMLTISELFNEISRLDTVDPIEAQYILYRNYISLKYPDIEQRLLLLIQSLSSNLNSTMVVHMGQCLQCDLLLDVLRFVSFQCARGTFRQEP